MKSLFRMRVMGWLAVAAVAAIVAMPQAKANSIEAQWTLDGVNFDNGAIASGFFLVTYNRNCSDCPFTATLTGFDISVTGGNTTPTTFTPSNTNIATLTGPLNGCTDADNDGDCDTEEDPLFDLIQNDPQELQLGTMTLEPPIGTNPNDIPLETTSFYQTGDPTTTHLVSGGLDGEIVPEPASVFLMLTGGLGLLGLAWRKRAAGFDGRGPQRG